MSLVPMTIDNLLARAGEEIGCSSWHPIAQETINAFADVTDDHQFIHVDPVLAAQTPFGKPIAHGFLVLSLLGSMAKEVMPRIATMAMGLNYGFDRVRFIAPVPVDSRIRGRFRFLEGKPRSEKSFILTSEVTVEIQGVAKPALIANWLTMIELA